MTINVDRERCVAAGTCVMSAPAVFDQDDDGIVELLQADPADDEGVADAVARCPAAAIAVTA